MACTGLCRRVTGFYATQGIFYAIPGSFLKGKSAAAGIALVTSMGILGGFAGPAWIGWMKDATGSYQFGLMTLAIPCLTGVAITASLKISTLAKTDRLESAAGRRSIPCAKR